MDRNSESIIAGRILAMPRTDYQTRGMDPSSDAGRVAEALLKASAYSTQPSAGSRASDDLPHTREDDLITHLWVA
jgi:hypothetical protein